MSIQPRGREPPVSSGLAQPQVWQKGTKEQTSSVVKTQDVESGELGSIPFSSGCNSRVGRITSPAQPWNSSPGEVADSCLSSAGKALTGLQTSPFVMPGSPALPALGGHEVCSACRAKPTSAVCPGRFRRNTNVSRSTSTADI